MFPSIPVLVCHSVKPSRDVDLQRLSPSIALRLVNVELLVLMSEVIALVICM